MPFYVINKDYNNKIFTNDNFDIDVLEFNTKEEAEDYLKNDENVGNNLEEIIVFTDGACSMNGSVNAKAGMGVYFGENDCRNISKRIEGKQTNNTAELSAVIEVFNILKTDIQNQNKITIYTDSEYSIKCCGSYGEKCEKKNWIKKNGGIPNVELVKKGYNLFKKNKNVQLKYIKAHTGKNDYLSKGNEGADKLANLSIEENNCPYTNIDKIINKDKKNYLKVPFSDKDTAKQNGAKWDKDKKKWYYLDNISEENKSFLISNFS